MSDDKPDETPDEVPADIEQWRKEKRARAEAIWKPFEEKWLALLRPKIEARDAVYENKFTKGTPARHEAEADIKGLVEQMTKEGVQLASEEDFESRWGTRFLPVNDSFLLALIFNNNPYATDLIRRDKELEWYRGWLYTAEVHEYAYAEYPERGLDEGYSYALTVLVDAYNTPREDVESMYLHCIVHGNPCEDEE